MLCVPSPPQVGNEGACCCSRIFQNSASTGASLQGCCQCRRCQRCSIQVLQKARADLHNSSVAVMLREMQREVNMGLSFGNELHIDFSTDHHPTQLHEANDIDCCFWRFFHGESWPDPRIMRKLWSKSQTESFHEFS